MEDLLKGEVSNDAAQESKESSQPDPTSSDILEVSGQVEAVGIGAKKKRKGGRLVGQTTDSQDKNDIETKPNHADSGSDAEYQKKSLRKKKKRKIKLSFDED